MLIALVHYSAPPVIGGVERVLAQQAACLIKHGHEVMVVCGNQDALVEGAVMHFFAGSGELCDLRESLKGFDVVIVHNMFTMPFHWDLTREIAKLSRELSDTRFINWVHDMDVTPEVFQDLDLKAIHVAVSQVRRDEFCERFSVPHDQCRVIPNGVDFSVLASPTDSMIAYAKAHEFEKSDIILFHPTRVLARKNIELGVEIIAELCSRGIDVLYVVTGALDPHRKESADYAKVIQNLINDRGLSDRVLFVSAETNVTNEDVQSLYLMADALLYPSKKEGFGLPLIEALSSRLPIFCSDITIHREVMSNLAYYLDLKSSPAVMADMICANINFRPSLKCAKAIQERYSWDRIYQDYLEPLLLES